MKYVIGILVLRACGIADLREPARRLPNMKGDRLRMVKVGTTLKMHRLMCPGKSAKLREEMKPWKKSSKLFTNLEQFHVKDQCCVRGNRAARSSSSITELRGNSQLS